MTEPSPPGASSPSASIGWWGRLRSSLVGALEDKGRLGCGIVIALVAFFVLRGIVPGLAGNRLPPALETAIAETYRRCDEDFPIHPGEVRMPTCDVVRAQRIGAGRPPAGAAGEGVTAVVCYRVELERLYWGETGPQKHEMAWAMRTVSKVAVLKGGTWTLFPDEEQGDASRWADFGCPGEYESSRGLEPRRSQGWDTRIRVDSRSPIVRTRWIFPQSSDRVTRPCSHGCESGGPGPGSGMSWPRSGSAGAAAAPGPAAV